MTNELKVQTITDQLTAELHVNIKEIRKRCLDLKVSDPQDQKNYSLVKASLSKMVSFRTGVEKIRKSLKADSLAYGREVDSKAAEITKVLLDGEIHLRDQKAIVDDEKLRIKREKEELIRLEEEKKRQEELERIKQIEEQQRIEREKLEKEKRAFEEAQAEVKRKQEEEEEKLWQQQEYIRLAKEKIEQDKINFEREKEEAEKNRLQAIKDEEQKRLDIEAAKRQAIIQEQERIERERLEKEYVLKLEKEKAAKLEALKPDQEKLEIIACSLENVTSIDVESLKAQGVVNYVESLLQEAIELLREPLN